MARRPPDPEATPRRPKERRVTMTIKGLRVLLHFADRLGQPDDISPDGLVLAWLEPGAILILAPDRERCVLRDDHGEAFFDLLGWCAYHRVEVDLLPPERFDAGFERDPGLGGEPQAVTFTGLSARDIDAFRDVVRGRGGLCMSDREFHGRDGPGEDPGGWPDTGILVVHDPAGAGSRARRGGAAPGTRTVTLYARNGEWLRTTAEALRTLVGSHGAGGRNVQ